MNVLGPRLINAGLRTSTPKLARHPGLLRSFQPAPLATRHFSSLGSGRSRLLEPFRRQASTFAGETSTAGTKWDYRRLAVTGALVGGALFLTDGFLNRETRADGLSAGERSLLNSTFQHTGGGLLLAAITARGLFRNGFAVRMMTMNPWVVMGGGLVASIGSMMVCFNSSPDNKVVKYGSWALFNAAQGAALSPLYFLAPAVLGRAALYTLGTVGGLSYVGATVSNPLPQRCCHRADICDRPRTTSTSTSAARSSPASASSRCRAWRR